MSNDYSWTPEYPQGPSRAQPEPSGYEQPTGDIYGQSPKPDWAQPYSDMYVPPAVPGQAEPYPPLAGGVYGQPTGEIYGQPVGGVYGQPTGGAYGQPVGGFYGQPTGDIYGRPTGGAYGQRTGDGYGQPATGGWGYGGAYAQPSMPGRAQPYDDPYTEPLGGAYYQPEAPGRADLYGDVFSQRTSPGWANPTRPGRALSDTNEIPKVEVTGSWSAMDTVVMQPFDMTLATGQIPPITASTRRRPSRNVTEHVAQRSGLPAGWFRRTVQSVVAVAVLVAASIAVSLLPTSSPQPAPQQVSSHISLTCPGVTDMQGSLVGVATSGATWQQPGGTPVTLDGSIFTQSSTGPSEVSGDGSVAALAQFEQPGMMAAVACAQPLASGFLQMISSDATMMMTNPDASDAVVSVFLMGPDGDVSAPQLIDMSVPAESTVPLSLGDYAPGVTPLGITWQSTVGRVVAWALTESPTSLDLASPTKADDDVVLPALPASAQVSLLLTNPASVRATANVQMMTADGSFDVVGGEQVSVEKRTTINLDLSSALQGQTGALRVHADMPLAVTLYVQTDTDSASAPGVPASQMSRPNLLGVVNGPAQLVLANNATRQVQVVVTMTSSSGADTPQTVTLAAGVSTVLDVPDGPQSITVRGTSAVVGSIILGQADADGVSSGVSLVPLTPDPAWRGTTPTWVEAQPHK